MYLDFTILVKQIYWYISQVSGERLQDHWSSGLGLRLKLFDCYRLFPFLQAFGDAYQLVPPSQKAGEVIAPYMVYNTTGLDLTLKLDSAFEVCRLLYHYNIFYNIYFTFIRSTATGIS